MSKYARVNTSALDAANYLLELADSESVQLDPLTLQKILFYCQCWSLHDGIRLFDDDVEAWKHGPVVGDVWKAYSGSSPIRPADNPRYYQLDDTQRDLVRSVWETLKGECGTDLSTLTHKDDSAWCKARGDLPPTSPSRRAISHEDMAAEVAEMSRRAEAALTIAWDDIKAQSK